MERWCFCASIPRVDNQTDVLVLRHLLETRKSTNTARIARLALAKMDILEWDSRTPPDAESWLKKHGNVWLAYPGETTADLATSKPDGILILDGTWRQVRKLLRSNPWLFSLPRLSLPPPTHAGRRMRVSPVAEGRSTIEAIAAALTLLEGPEKGEPLESLHSVMVEQVLSARGMPMPEEAAG